MFLCTRSENSFLIRTLIIFAIIAAGTVCGDQKDKFKIAYLIHGTLEDLSWSHNWGIAKTSIHRVFTEEFPEIEIVSSSVMDVDAEEASDHIASFIRQGYDLIVGCSFDYQEVMLTFSETYSNVTFVHVTGYKTGGPNFVQLDVKMYQPQYIAGFTAGKMSKVGKICYLKSLDVSLTRRWYNAYALGAKRANPNVEFYVMHLNSWIPPRETDIAEAAVEAIVTHGCDVVSGSINEATIYRFAYRNDLLATGFQGDWGPFTSQNTIISTVFDWNPVLAPFIRELIVNGSLDYIDNHQWIGMDAGAADVSDSSIIVPKEVHEEIQELRTQLKNNNFTIFCGPIVDNEGNTILPDGSCIKESELQANSMEWHLQDTINFGAFLLPARTCDDGTFYIYHPLNNTLSCQNCLPGEFSTTTRKDSCLICPQNHYSSEEGSSECSVCKGEQFSDPGSTKCTSPSKWWIYLIVALALAFASLLVFVFCFGVLFCYNRRKKLRYAPKKGRVTIVFSDIAESTLLTESLGKDMKTALAIHNNIIRKEIKKTKGYEVKTIGDSFMIAFSSSVQAIEFCLRCQKKLLHANWPQRVLEHPLCKPEYSEDNVLIHRGLRVRMGLNSGFVGSGLFPKYSRITGRYDYHGNSVNVAARLEAAGLGGYTLTSESEVQAVKTSLIDSKFQYECQMLMKGVSEPLSVYSVWKQPLDRRRRSTLVSSGKAKIVEENTDSFEEKMEEIGGTGEEKIEFSNEELNNEECMLEVTAREMIKESDIAFEIEENTGPMTEESDEFRQNELGKDELGKDELGKDELGKEELGKDELGKDELGKDELSKEEVSSDGPVIVESPIIESTNEESTNKESTKDTISVELGNVNPNDESTNVITLEELGIDKQTNLEQINQEPMSDDGQQTDQRPEEAKEEPFVESVTNETHESTTNEPTEQKEKKSPMDPISNE